MTVRHETMLSPPPDHPVDEFSPAIQEFLSRRPDTRLSHAGAWMVLGGLVALGCSPGEFVLALVTERNPPIALAIRAIRAAAGARDLHRTDAALRVLDEK